VAKRRGLGRGLEALIPPVVRQPESSGLMEVPINSIVRNPLQPRQHMDEQGLQELADSIREHGLLQPLIVTQMGSDSGDVAASQYQLIAGERRLTAARMAGLSLVPVVIKEASDQQLLEMALVENIQRADLNVLEEANAYQQLSKEFGLSQQEIAAKVGKSRAAVANVMRLLRLPPDIQALVSEGDLSEGHARALLTLKQVEDQRRLAQDIISRGLSVRQTEDLVRQNKEPPPKKSASRKKGRRGSSHLTDVEEQFRRALGTKVQLKGGRKGGRLIIFYYSEEELQGLYDLLVKEA